MKTSRIALAVLLIAAPGIAIAADSPMPDDESAFVAQFTFDAQTGAILAAPPAYKNKGAVDHSADWNAYSSNASSGSLDAAAPNASAALAQGAVDHTADWAAYTSNASSGSLDAAAPNASAALAQGAVDHAADWAAYTSNASNGSLDAAAPNASAALAQGALDFTDEFNSMVVDPVEGRIVSAQPYSTYVQKIVPTLAFWGALVLTALLLYGLIIRHRKGGTLNPTH